MICFINIGISRIFVDPLVMVLEAIHKISAIWERGLILKVKGKGNINVLHLHMLWI